MPDYLLVKTLHIFSAVVLLGVGLGSVFYKFMADRSGNHEAMALTNRLVVLADTWFTTPTLLIQPLSGLYLVARGGYAWQQTWLQVGLVLYVVAVLCWLPVVVLQLRMRNTSTEVVANGTALSPAYWRDARRWQLLGVPAFLAMLGILWLMVARPV